MEAKRIAEKLRKLAFMLNGRESGDESRIDIQQYAEREQLVYVYVYDDVIELRGAIHAEIPADKDTELFVTEQGLLEICEEGCSHYRRAKENASRIIAMGDDIGEPSWKFETSIVRSTFTIWKDNLSYCEGIVFSLKQLGAK